MCMEGGGGVEEEHSAMHSNSASKCVGIITRPKLCIVENQNKEFGDKVMYHNA